MLAFLITGIGFGLSAGMSPGPLMALVISETLKHRTKAGLLVALAPLITDAPIVLLCFYLLNRFKNLPILLSVISLLGSIYVFWLAYQSIRIRSMNAEIIDAKNSSLIKGVMTNFLSPHPYLFWITVGTPIMTSALQIGHLAIFLFCAGFYFCLIGLKIGVAILVGQSKNILSDRVFIFVNQLMGVVLGIFAVLLLRQGLKLLFETL